MGFGRGKKGRKSERCRRRKEGRMNNRKRGRKGE